MDKIKCIIFDMDNTLIDRQKSAWLAIEELVELDFSNMTIEEKNKIIKQLYIDDAEGHVSKEGVFNKYIEENKITGKTWEDYNEMWLKILPTHTMLYPETISVLDYLRQNYRLGMITNGASESQHKKMEGLGFEAYFDEILVSGDFGIDKPNPEIFLELCKRMGVTPEECVFVGDGLENDIKGSLGVGMKAIWIYPFVDCRTDLPCQRIYRIQDLRDFL